MYPIAPSLENPRPDSGWHQDFINAVSPYNLGNSALLSGKSYIPIEHRPKRLYRYSSYQKEYVEMACQNELHLSEPSNLNDPYDLYANIDATKILDWLAPYFDLTGYADFISYLKENSFRGNGHILPRFFDNIRYTYDKCIANRAFSDVGECVDFIFKSDFKSVMRYASFSETCDNSSMWAYYANNHNGYCLEYELLDEAWLPRDFSGSIYSALLPVVYTDIPFDGNEFLRNTMVKDLSKLDAYGFALLVVLCLQKMSVWCHEKEWRLILSSETDVSKVSSQLSPVRLSAIHVGLKMEEPKVNELTMVAKTSAIPVYRIGVHKDTLHLCSAKDTPVSLIFPR